MIRADQSKKIKSGLIGIVTFWLSLSSLPAMAGMCAGIWDAPIQSHGQGISLAYGTALDTAGAVLPAREIYQSNSVRACNGERCEASGQASASLTLPDFVYSQSEQNVSVQVLQSAPTRVKEGVEFDTLSVAYGSSLEFDPAIPLRIIDRLELAAFSTVRLPPGDYWINHLTVQAYGKLEATGSGTVRLFVNQTADFGYGADLSAPSGNDILLIGYQNLVFWGNNRIDAQLYSQEASQLGVYGRVTGRLTGAPVRMEFASNLSDRLISESALHGLCNDAGPMRDTDGDQRPDGIDPDADGDGYYNFEEINAGSDPFDATSTPEPADDPDIPGLPDEWDSQDANACTNTFTNGLQTHGANGVIEFGYNAQLRNPSSLGLLTGSIRQPHYTGVSHCESGACYALGQPAAELPAIDSPALQGNERLTVRFRQAQALTAADSQRYRFIRVGARASLALDATQDLFRAGDLWLQSRATLVLTPGDYFFDSLHIDARARVLVEGEGTARLHVANELRVLPFGQINADDSGFGDAAKVLLDVGGYVDINYQAEVSALIYSDDQIDSQGVIRGAMSGRRINLRAFATLDYDPDAVWRQDFGTHCDIDDDGIYDGRDPDRDGDGISNDYEKELGFDPNDPNSTPPDQDGDGIPDALDTDRDGDGHPNETDAFPDDPNEWSDLDGDGIGDNSDPDRDGDGFDNTEEIEAGTDPNDATDYPDRIAPTVSIEQAPALTRLAQAEVLASAADEYSGLASVVLTNSTTGDTVPMQQNEAGAWAATVALVSGQNSLSVTATDNWGNQASSETQVNRDSQAPVMTRIQPNSDQTSATNITVSYSVTDENSGVSSVTLIAPSGPIEPVVSGNQYQFDVPLSEGSNAFTVNAQDNAGNSSSAQLSILSDVTAPRFDELQIPELVNAPEQTISGRISDNLTSIELSLTLNDQSVPVTSSVDNEVLAFTAELALTEGANELVLVATDAVGNQRTEARSINLDTQVPEITVIEPAPYWQAEPDYTLAGQVTDDNSGVASLVYQHGNQGGSLTLDDTGNFALPLTLVEGEQQIHLTATDAAGNGQSISIDIAFDTTEPTLQPDQSSESLTGAAEWTLSGSASDAGSGVASLLLYWPGDVEPQALSLNNGQYQTVIALSEGVQTGRLVVTDAVGLSTEWPFTVTADFTGPTVQISPPDGYLTNQPQLDARVTLSDEPAGLQEQTLSLNGTVQALPGDDNSPSLTLTEGLNEVIVQATDTVGNQSLNTFTWNLDTQAPTLERLAPQAEWTSAAKVLVRYTAQDENSGVRSLSAGLTGEQPQPMALQNGEYQTELSVEEGDHTVQVTATDEAGNTAQQSFLIWADHTPPRFTNLSVPLLVNQAALTVTGEVSDALSGLGDVSLHLNGLAQTLSLTETSQGTAFTADVTLEEGSNTLTLVATDALGNEQQLAYTVSLDSQAPTIELATPEPYWRGDNTLRFTGQISDDSSGLEQITYRWGGADETLTLDSTGSFSLDLTLVEGDNTLTVTALDRAQNTAQATVSAGLDTTPPELKPDQNSALMTLNNEVTLSGQVIDLGSGVASLVLHRSDRPESEAVTLTDGRYDLVLPLTEGQIEGRLVVTDQVGLSAEWPFTVMMDITPPALTLTPDTGYLTNTADVTAEWTVTEEGAGLASQELRFNGDSLAVTAEARSQALTLVEGTNTLALIATDAVGNVAEQSVTWVLDTQPPQLSWLSSAEPTSDADYLARAQLSDSSAIESHRLLVNGTPAGAELEGDTLSAPVSLQEGNNLLVLTATDTAGNAASVQMSILLDSTAPVLTLGAYEPVTAANSITLTGQVTDASALQVTLGEQSVVPDADGGFSVTVPLQEGGNTLLIQAIDALNNLAQQSLDIISDQQGPTVSWNAPSLTDQEVITLTGSASDDYTDVSRLSLVNQSLGGTAFEVTLTDGAFTTDVVLAPGINQLVWNAEDEVGNESAFAFNIELQTSQLSWAWLSHQDGSTVAEPELVLEGLLTSDAPMDGIAVTIDGAAASINRWDDDQYSVRSHRITLEEGENRLTVQIQTPTDSAQEHITLFYAVEDEPPVEGTLSLTVDTPANGAQLATEQLAIRGELESASRPWLEINGEAVTLQASAPYYRFNHSLTVPAEIDSWTLTFNAYNEAGDTEQVTRTVRIDRQAPQVSLQRPLADYPTVNPVLEDPYPFAGTVTDANLASVTLNNQVLPLTPASQNSYAFNLPLALAQGAETTLQLTAVDHAGNRSQFSWVLQSTRSIDMSWLLPAAASQFVTRDEPFPVQLILRSSDKTSGPGYRARWVNLADEATSDWLELDQEAGLVSGELMLNGQPGNYRFEVQALNDQSLVVAQAPPREFSINQPQALDVAIVRTVPEANANNVDTKEAIGIFFNQSIDPQGLDIAVYETVQGRTWLNQDAAGTEFFNAKGHQLVTVSRNHEPVPGSIRVLPERKGFLFQPAREPAYGATLSVEVSYQGEIQTRYQYQTEPLPTLVTVQLKDQYDRPVNGLRVKLGDRETVSANGIATFGYGNELPPLPSGDYLLWVNPNQANNAYGETRLSVPVDGGRNNELGTAPVSFLNPETGATYLQSGTEVVLLNGAVRLDTRSGSLAFRDGQPEGEAHVQFNRQAGLNYPTHPLVAPNWMYSVQPLGITVDGDFTLSFELPALQGGHDYLPDDGALGLLLGVNPRTERIEPLGVVQRNQNRAEVLPGHQLTVLDHVGAVFLPGAAEELLQDYVDGTITLAVLMTRIANLASEPTSQEAENP